MMAFGQVKRFAWLLESEGSARLTVRVSFL